VGCTHHRGAKEGMSRLDNKTANNKFLTINAETFSKSEFYELLSNDNSIASQRALALIDELEFTVKPPVFSHISIVLSGVVSFFFFFFFFVFLTIVFAIITLGQEDPFSAPPPPYLALRIVATIFPLVPLVIAARICMSIILGVKSAKNTKYEFIKGLIKITKGAFTVKTEIVELYRIKGINVVQDWFSKITGYATLELINDKSQKVVLPGIAEARRAYYLQDRLRELTVLLRSLPWIKGFIS
jgi:membrane protein YdbS with pleckstrin-like domain